jgi:peptide deformylase
MALIEIVKYPDKILEEKTSKVTGFDSSIQKLIDDMIETMYAAPGIGLAANQVGVNKQIAVIDVSGQEEKSELVVLINPEITHLSDELEIEEGCLSVPGYTTIVKRAKKVNVKCLDRNGEEIVIEGDDLLSRALQHEIDHLNGFLIIDRIGRIKKEFFKKRYSRHKYSSSK